MSKLQNKVAVITGGISGIGLAAAKRFVEGATVYQFARRPTELNFCGDIAGPPLRFTEKRRRSS